MKNKTLLTLACFCALATNTYADTDSELSQKANDPTASLMAVQLIDGYVSDFYNTPENETGNSISLRAAYPYTWGKTKHILRVTQPYTTKSPSGESGFEDLTLFDMALYPASWGRFGVGIVAAIPLADGNKQWSVGPAVGFVNNTLAKGVNIGLFNQNLFRIAGDDGRDYTRISSFQPIINYSIGGGWNVGGGDLQFIYDWSSSQWVSLPVSLQVGKLIKFGDLPVNISAQYQHNFADEVTFGNGLLAPTSKNTFTITAKFLFPKF